MKTRLSAMLTVLFVAILGYAQEVSLVKTIFPQDHAPRASEVALRVHFIDVGAGDAMLIQTPSGKNILIDGGWTLGDKGVSEKYLAYLEHYITSEKIDLLIISHPDYDHIAGLGQVLDKYPVREVWYSGYTTPALEKPTSTWGKLKTKITREPGCTFVSPLREKMGLGTSRVFDDNRTPQKNDDVILTLINTVDDIGVSAKTDEGRHAYGSTRKYAKNEPSNSSSAVVRMDFGPTSFLFAGDTNGRKEEEHDSFDLADQNLCEDQELFMVENDAKVDSPLFHKLHVNVLKMPHHGSDSSGTLPFLKAVKPDWVVISAGTHFHHPRLSTLGRLEAAEIQKAQILRTDEGEADLDKGAAPESTIGNQCYVFTVDTTGISKVEMWKVTADSSN